MSDNNQIIQTPFQEDMQKSSGLIIAVGILDLMEIGIDGLTTDDPAMAYTAIKDIGRLSPMERLMLRFRHLWD